MNPEQRLAKLKLDRSRPVPRQIYAQLRSLILSGEFTPATKIPSTKALARLWQIQEPTVHSGMAPLVKEGLLARHRGIGTFVRQREERLTCVGVFDKVIVNDSLYLQALHKALQEELRQAGIEMDLRLDPRPEEQWSEPWQPCWHAAAHREFQAAIVTNTSEPHLRWQTKLPVPTVYHGVPDIPNAVNTDLEQFAELSVQTLAQQGCRSVGLVCGLSAGNAGFYRRLMDRIGDLGLTVKNEWMRLPMAERNMNGGVAQERFGHEEFLRLWGPAKRPEGLIGFPDTVARGVILGLLEKQVRVPAELKLVLHKNEAVDLYCPVPATLLVLSEREIARALIAQVQKQFRGEPCEPINIPFRLMAHRGNS